MKEPLSIETERVADIPLLLTQMQRMNRAELLDKHFPNKGKRARLILGWMSAVWLTHIL